MSTYFNRKEVPENTQNEITRREDSSDWITNGRTTYVQITSMCDKCDPKYQLSLQASINPETAQNKDKAFRAQTALDQRLGTPIQTSTINMEDGNYAHVAGLKVQKQGELGTSRKATVQIRCNTDEELIALQKCYFIPGMSVRIQWGWASWGGPKYTQPIAVPDKLLDADAIVGMTDHTTIYPNNEGMQGPVANFGYTWNQKNKQWDCFIEVISATSGVTIEANCIKDKPTCVNTKGADDKDRLICLDDMEELLELEAAKGVNLSTWGMVAAGAVGVAFTAVTFGTGALVLAASAAAAAAAGVGISSILRNNNSRRDEEYWTSVFQYEGETRDPLNFGKADGGFFSDTMGTGTNEAYISLGKLTDIINRVAAKKGEKLCNFENQILITPEHLGCSDARICFIPGTKYLEHLLDDYKASQVPPAFKVVAGNKGEVTVNLIAVNAIHALQVYHEMKEAAGEDPATNKKIVVIEEYLNRMLNDINVSCGNPWQDLRVESEDKQKTLVVVERQSVGNSDITPPPPFLLPTGGGIYVISELKLELKMTGAMKTQAVYGSNDSLGSGDKCTQPKFQAFGLSTGLFKNLGKPDRVEIKPCEPTAEEKAHAEERAAEILTTEELFEEAGNGHSDSDCTNLADRLSNIYDFKADPVTGIPPKSVSEAALAAACKNIPLPFEMSFQMDGIGGFGFGQVVTCSRIPKEIRKNFEFQILNVDHTINNESWSIGVTTVARTNPTSQSNG